MATSLWNIQSHGKIWSIIVPPLLTVILFILTISLLGLPFIRETVMAHKREMIRELTASAWSDLLHFEQKEKNGLLTRAEAQRQASEHIRHLRFGPENKDYFWINDLRPYMIMHPYRTDLEGQDISDFADPEGKALFTEFVRVVEQHGSGYVDYMWQWKDDPGNIVPKISYVKGFQPWGWIIGTGVYIEDVRAEIAMLTRNLILVCTLITAVVTLLAAIMVWRGVNAERQRRRAAAEARRHLVKLAHLSRLQTLQVMASQLAHEIDQPLGVILIQTSMCARLLREGQSEPEELLETFEGVSQQVERTARIVKRIRDFSRRHEPRRTRVDIHTVIAEILEFLAADIKYNKVALDFSPTATGAGAPEPLWAMVDTTLIEQVVMNLVRNAIDALSECDTDRRRLAIRVTTEDQMIRVAVCDNGPGIAADQLDSIFETFHTTKKDGLGVGLAISRAIIEAHDGRLQVEANPGGGCIFHFTLPLIQQGNRYTNK